MVIRHFSHDRRARVANQHCYCTQSSRPTVEHRVPGTEYRVPSTGYRVPGTGGNADSPITDYTDDDETRSAVHASPRRGLFVRFGAVVEAAGTGRGGRERRLGDHHVG